MGMTASYDLLNSAAAARPTRNHSNTCTFGRFRPTPSLMPADELVSELLVEQKTTVPLGY